MLICLLHAILKLSLFVGTLFLFYLFIFNLLSFLEIYVHQTVGD